MNGQELLAFVLAMLAVLVVPVTALVLGIVALVRTSRIARLESRLARLEASLGPEKPEPATPPPIPERLATAEIAPIVEPAKLAARERAAAVPREPAGRWELLIGQKALGWIAVVLAIFAVSFFLKYAYDSRWIGPQGQVAVAEVAGLILLWVGLRCHRRGARIFSEMLSACGVVVLYLSTYGAFGFYRLLSHTEAGWFLAAIVALSMAVALLYDSRAVALVALLGGLAAPLLLRTEQDAYRALFVYLALLNGGVGAVTLARGWAGLGTVALAGTQVLYWTWYAGNYHPEKFAWAIGFQAVVFVLYLAQDLAVQFRRLPGALWESSGRMVGNAALWFAASYVLARRDYRPWLGTAALAMAVPYALVARALLRFQGRYTAESLTAVALAVGFVTLAIPLEAEARWIALGWSACGAALWWFGVRVGAAPLRALAGLVAAMGLVRLALVDLGSYPHELLVPVLNRIALPSLGVAMLPLAAMALARRHRVRSGPIERSLACGAGVVFLVALWGVLSVDLYRHFLVRAELALDSAYDWRRLGQMSLSILWTLYASLVLAVGFRWRVARLRWLAIAFYGITVAKVFLLDMAGLPQLYRIVAFVAVAAFLAMAARLYQRAGRRWNARAPEESN